MSQFQPLPGTNPDDSTRFNCEIATAGSQKVAAAPPTRIPLRSIMRLWTFSTISQQLPESLCFVSTIGTPDECIQRIGHLDEDRFTAR